MRYTNVFALVLVVLGLFVASCGRCHGEEVWNFKPGNKIIHWHGKFWKYDFKIHYWHAWDAHRRCWLK